MKKVLIAEDEASIRDFVVINLRRSGYEVIEAADGTEAMALFDGNHSEIDIAILDIMMPGADGLEVCKYLRSKSKRIGIIMLTARTQEMDKVTGLLVGADDYVTKPFSPSELMARIDAVYRRVTLTNEAVNNANETENSAVTLNEFTLDLRSHTLTKNGEPIDLTQVEFQIMEYFFSNPNAALSRSDILKFVWGDTYFGDEKIVDVNIHRLRNKVEDEPSSPVHLITVWGMGYKWII
ncbi:MAG: response regulator transcription factor [Oscillospiraceae bacterium]|nr:response regulator transcription factor [Oscillospiraceae bacterium]